MMRITFLNQKGGVGKSTVTILLGSALHTAGYKVVFRDMDKQASVTFWTRQIGRIPLEGEIENPEVILCDTPGHIDSDPKAFLQPLIEQSDRLVVVSEKSIFSIQATVSLIEMVNGYKRRDARAYILFNKVRMNTKIGRQSEEDLAQNLGLSVLKNSLPLAAPFENLQYTGFPAVTGKHREMVLNLALEILK